MPNTGKNPLQCTVSYVPILSVGDYRVMTSKPVDIGLKALVLIFALNMGSSVIKTGRNEGSLLPYIEWFNMRVFIHKQISIKTFYVLNNVVTYIWTTLKSF